jgi:hypothetical protein
MGKLADRGNARMERYVVSVLPEVSALSALVDLDAMVASLPRIGLPGVEDLVGASSPASDALDLLKALDAAQAGVIAVSPSTCIFGVAARAGFAEWQHVLTAPVTAVTEISFRTGPLNHKLSVTIGGVGIAGVIGRHVPSSARRYADLPGVARGLGWPGRGGAGP